MTIIINRPDLANPNPITPKPPVTPPRVPPVTPPTTPPTVPPTLPPTTPPPGGIIPPTTPPITNLKKIFLFK